MFPRSGTHAPTTAPAWGTGHVCGRHQASPTGHATGAACRAGGGRVEGLCLRGGVRAGCTAARRGDCGAEDRPVEAGGRQETRRQPPTLPGSHGATPTLDRLRLASAAARGPLHNGRDGGPVDDRRRGGAPRAVQADHRPHRVTGGRQQVDGPERRPAGQGAQHPHVGGMAPHGVAQRPEHSPRRVGRVARLAQDAKPEAGRDRPPAAGREHRPACQRRQRVRRVISRAEHRPNRREIPGSWFPRGWVQIPEHPSDYRFSLSIRSAANRTVQEE